MPSVVVRSTLICGVGAILLGAAAFPAGAVAAPRGCDAVAALAGPGTAQRFVNSLSAGETGCLRGGTYEGNVVISHGGTSRKQRITLTSYPHERATIRGKLWITDSANFVTISRLSLDGRNEGNIPSPVVNGDDVILAHNEVTNHHTGICVDLGPHPYGRAWRTRVVANRIHDCGRLPATNHEHGLYVGHSSGARIFRNRIYDNADRGIQLYPDAQDTRITRNRIESNGEGVLFGGEDGQSSNNNVVVGNVIKNSRVGLNIVSYYPRGTPVGVGNVVNRNAIFGGVADHGNGGIGPRIGFSSRHNDTSP